jgi:8-oxo-dGTP pyrophosphatase MutT (NUDIX family)
MTTHPRREIGPGRLAGGIIGAIEHLVANVQPHDTLEADHQLDALNWIRSRARIFRVAKPDDPPKHLVSYFFVDHITSGLWLPAGGHVEPNEHPWRTVSREMLEELRVEAVPIRRLGAEPLFVTVTDTQGTPSHVDVSLWFVVTGPEGTVYDFDKREFRACRWMSFDEVLTMSSSTLDPHAHRFIAKLDALLSSWPVSRTTDRASLDD